MSDTKSFYSERLELLEKELQACQKKYNQTSNYRLFLLIAGAIIIYFLTQSSFYGLVFFITLWLTGFYFLVKYHEGIESDLLELKSKSEVLKNELHILQKVPNIYDDGHQFYDEKHPFTADLDIFGPGSLYHLVNRSSSTDALLMTKDQLLSLKSSDQIKELQAAVKELVNHTEWRLNYQASLLPVMGWNSDILKNLEEVPRFKFEKLVALYPVLKWILALMVVGAFYWKGVETGIYCLVILLAFNYSLTALNRKHIGNYLDKMVFLSRNLNRLQRAIGLIRSMDWTTERLKYLKAKIPGNFNPIEEFDVIARKIEIKDNQFAAFFVNLFSPFELVQMLKLRLWLKNYPDFFETILSIIAEVEYLNSLAILAFNHPEWTFPDFTPKGEIIIDDGAHPLIFGAVTNSFELNESNQLSLITGSNMSGKSTFLRTIGVNVVLAYAGAVVCARRFVLPADIELYAYMRIKDSIQQNVSTFKSEIDRLQLLLQAMDSGKNVLLLVDEMLRGTNSEDKLKGSMAFLKRIMDSTSKALVATHDLRMTEILDYNPRGVGTYFFEYRSDHGQLQFDYLLKEGICQSFNASELLRSIGLKL